MECTYWVQEMQPVNENLCVNEMNEISEYWSTAHNFPFLHALRWTTFFLLSTFLEQGLYLVNTFAKWHPFRAAVWRQSVGKETPLLGRIRKNYLVLTVALEFQTNILLRIFQLPTCPTNLDFITLILPSSADCHNLVSKASFVRIRCPS